MTTARRYSAESPMTTFLQQWNVDVDEFTSQDWSEVEKMDATLRKALLVAGAIGLGGVAGALCASAVDIGLGGVAGALGTSAVDIHQAINGGSFAGPDLLPGAGGTAVEVLKATADSLPVASATAGIASVAVEANNKTAAGSAASASGALMLVSGSINLIQAGFFIHNAKEKTKLVEELKNFKAMAGLESLVAGFQEAIASLRADFNELRGQWELFNEMLATWNKAVDGPRQEFTRSIVDDVVALNSRAKTLQIQIVEAMHQLKDMQLKSEKAKQSNIVSTAVGTGGAVRGVTLMVVSIVMTGGGAAVGLLVTSAVVNGGGAVANAAGVVISITNWRKCNRLFGEIDRHEKSLLTVKNELDVVWADLDQLYASARQRLPPRRVLVRP